MDRKSFKELWHFVGHVFGASVAFVSIALITLGIQYIVGFVSENGYSKYVSICLQIVEYIVFTIDIIAYLAYVIKKAQEFISKLYSKNEDDEK